MLEVHPLQETCRRIVMKRSLAAAALIAAISSTSGWALSDDQKKTADELLAPHMGMGMMASMRGEMQPGGTMRGQMSCMGPAMMGPAMMQGRMPGAMGDQATPNKPQ
jgi:hypothetical protein